MTQPAWESWVDLLPTAVFLCDALSGALLRANRPLAEWVGGEPEAGIPLERLFAPVRLYSPEGTPLPFAATPFGESLRARAPAPGRVVLVEGPAGSRRACAVAAHALRGARGEEMLLFLLQDVTELEQLRRRSERWRRLCEAARAVVADWDVPADRVEWEGAVARVLGLAPEELGASRRVWLERLHPADRERVAAALFRWIEEGEPDWGAEYRFLRGDGVYVDLMERAFAVRDERGRATRIVAVLQEVPPSHSAEVRLRLLMAISRAIDEAGLRWSDVLHSIAGQVARELGDLCVLRLVSPDGAWLDAVAAEHRDPARMERLRELLTAPLRVGESWAGVVAATGESLLRNAVTAAELQAVVPPAFREQVAGCRIHSVLVVPLRLHGRVTGTLLAARDVTPAEYSPEDRSFLEDISTRAAIALEHARLHRESEEARGELEEALEREMRIAEELQECFRSRIPARIPGYLLGHAYQPAMEDALLGGDFYDVFPLGRQRFGIMIGDVSGKGLQAAVDTVKTRYYLQGYAIQHPEPVRAIRMLNDVLCEHLHNAAFVSLFYAVLDVSAHRMTYVTAGHEPPLALLPGAEAPQPLDTTGPVLGVIPGMRYEQRNIELPPGSLLLLYTDGVTDARSDSGFLGRTGLAQLLLRRRSQWEGQALVDALVADVEAFARGFLRDDLAVLLLQRPTA